MVEIRWFLTALLLMFIGLKLGRVIDWSWWWVIAPFWAPLALAIIGQIPLWLYRQWFEPEHDRNNRQLIEAIRAYSDKLRGD